MKPLPASHSIGVSREDAALVVGLHVVEPGRRIERRRVPVRRTRRATGTRVCPRATAPCWARRSAGLRGVRPLAQVTFFAYCLPNRNVPFGAIEHVEEAVAVGLHEQLARLPLPRRVDERRRFLRVVVPHVVRRELEMPLQRAGLRVERDDRIGIEVVAAAIVADQIGRRIAGRPVDRVQLPDRRCRSATSSRPDARCLCPATSRTSARRGAARSRSARLPCRSPDRSAATKPRTPSSPPDVPVTTRLPTGERRAGRVVVLAPVGHLGFPEQRAGEAIERDDVRVIGDHEHAVAGDADAAVDAARGVADETLGARPAGSARSRGRARRRARSIRWRSVTYITPSHDHRRHLQARRVAAG